MQETTVSSFLILLKAVGAAGRPAIVLIAHLPIILIAVGLLPALMIGVSVLPARYAGVLGTTISQLCTWSSRIIATAGVAPLEEAPRTDR
ncbi:hypothetical protein [Actinoplanes friuliensis]|uniref:Uncharacterized protein n=1 Tax=Actinoplanes friuliensis DSM 7358 TaxID=1246995 RepID=U5VZQ4_9ACTN|nr:hypothetical protein [Actinoplanes friuliensis]AGZ42473.1 hypothetical protein AFR_21005 [Actinoplanes friuliensis DSM 7358]